MLSKQDIYEAVFRFADAILRVKDKQLQLEGLSLVKEDIARAIDDAIQFAIQTAALPKDAIPLPESICSELYRNLDSRYFTTMAMGMVLDDATGHVPWLLNRKSEINWHFWRRYARYLEEETHFPRATIARLDQLTDEILQRLEEPSRPGPWDRRGMVVGQVQSGKTSNYTGLICKAADVGYRLIIVLAGIHNSLRSQTQLRLDEGFLGFDTQKNLKFDQTSTKIGVGRLRGAEIPVAHALTSSSDTGDFKRTVVNAVNVSLGSNDPLLLVVKKNTSVLKNLMRWITSSERAYIDPHSQKRRIRDVPLLIIDDEADNASINTKIVIRDEEGNVLDDEDPSAINGLIRVVLNTFDKSAYVGYTATPFANIFIHPKDTTEEHGEDLFPRSFIINLQTPSNYVGPVQIFGLGEEREEEPLPIIRTVYDYDSWIPDGHKKELTPGPLPHSLKEAILAFVLVIASRLQRGQDRAHNSMLVHATRFTAVQTRIKEQINDFLYEVQGTVAYGAGDRTSSVLDELQNLWERDFTPTTEAVEPAQMTPWSKIQPYLHAAASRIVTKEINGKAKDVLDYWENPQGLSVIAIGGEKLSRGLTLEGLSVSYYLRAARMYDTLMQMGRWFGYRPGYLDLCRLYTSPELIEWYKHITSASEELRDEFEAMTSINATPRDYGLKVRTHPSGLNITSVSKMRSGTIMQVSFAGRISETVVFSCHDSHNKHNLAVLERLLLSLGKCEERERNSDNLVWRDVSSEQVITFLEGYRNHPESRASNPQLLKQYIEGRNADGELGNWTVAVISNAQGETYSAGRHTIGMTRRKDDAGPGEPRYLLPKRHLLSPGDEAIDLSITEFRIALADTNGLRNDQGKQDTDIPSGPSIRARRPATRGLLLIYLLNPTSVSDKGATVPIPGFVVSFPATTRAKEIEYTVNNVYFEQEFEIRES